MGGLTIGSPFGPLFTPLCWRLCSIAWLRSGIPFWNCCCGFSGGLEREGE